ncbi:hypothetical protein UABAM_06207 [Candidatus Uabimicrobium amorphum]|uniref:Uncharacterized protein n=1 Tax=Uabimicrobium amorphum TaxID=2596890 RepID=A0A5S9F803_UABAM|nr:hypothetical protein UABAM_06207 [Candidatus Uabimicrobium amorphum]
MEVLNLYLNQFKNENQTRKDRKPKIKNVNTDALRLSRGRGMRIKAFSEAETFNSMVRAPTWKC